MLPLNGINWQLINPNSTDNQDHRHLSNIDCLTARTACLVCFISTVNGCSKKKRKEAY
jgi:hypothetical protein